MNIKKYIGKPYIDKEYDCYGLCRDVYKHELDVELNPYGFLYATAENNAGASLAIDTVVKDDNWTRVEKPNLYDLVLFNINGFVSHIGIYLGNKQFLHCMKGRSVCIESLDDVHWRHRIEGYVQWNK